MFQRSTFRSVIPLIGHQQCSAGQCIPSLGEEGRLQQTAHLVPVGERLCGCCGQPYCCPAERAQEECWCEAKTTTSDSLKTSLQIEHTRNAFISALLTYIDPIKATSNQKARPCTRPECIMWNLKGISILGGKGKGRETDIFITLGMMHKCNLTIYSTFTNL